MKFVSTLNSGVKYFESQTASLLRALPFSQVKSAYANGADGSAFAGVACCGETVAAMDSGVMGLTTEDEMPAAAGAGCAAESVVR